MYCLSKAKLMQCLFKLNLVNAIMALLRGFVSMWYRVIYLKRDMIIMYNILHFKLNLVNAIMALLRGFVMLDNSSPSKIGQYDYHLLRYTLYFTKI